MPTKQVTITNAVDPGTPLFDVDPNRVAFSILNTSGYAIYVYDSPASVDTAHLAVVEHGEMFEASVFEGDDVTHRWYAVSIQSGSHTIRVYEAFKK